MIITGSNEKIIELLCGLQQSNEHCKGYRWHQYLADQRKRMAAVDEVARQMIARANAARDGELIQMAAE